MKNAQEAHEAIRPAGETFRTPDEAGRSLTGTSSGSTTSSGSGPSPRRWPTPPGTSAQVRLTATVAGGAGLAGAEVEFAASGRVDHVPRIPPGLRRG